MPEVDVISLQCYYQPCSWYYQRIVRVKGHVLKIDIQRDAYDHQSHARVERWDGSKWQFVYAEPITACYCRTVSYTAQDISAAHFEKDDEALLLNALQILA